MTTATPTDLETAEARSRSVQRLVRADELLAHDYPMALARNPNDDGAFDGCCPCGTITGENFVAEFHCWRSGCEHGCKYSGIHVSGGLDHKTKMKIAKHIRDNNGWTNHTDWTLVVLGSNDQAHL